jgi:hypothetical protein
MNILYTLRAVLLGLSIHFELYHIVPLLPAPYLSGIVVLFSVIVLALAAALINTTESQGFYFIFAALALAVSLLTLLIVSPL